MTQADSEIKSHKLLDSGREEREGWEMVQKIKSPEVVLSLFVSASSSL